MTETRFRENTGDSADLKRLYQEAVEDSIVRARVVLEKSRLLIFIYSKLPFYFSTAFAIVTVMIWIIFFSDLYKQSAFYYAINTVGCILDIYFKYILFKQFRAIQFSIDEKASAVFSTEFQELSYFTQEDRYHLDEIYKIAKSMRVAPMDFRVVIDRSNYSFLPSIRNCGIDYIILPVGWVFLFDSARNKALALLAHEIAHVRQQDSRLWVISNIFASELYRHAQGRILLNLIFPTILIFLVFLADFDKLVQILEYHNSILNLLFKIPISAMLLSISVGYFLYIYLSSKKICFEIRQARFQSEYMADLAGIAYTEPGAMLSAIEEYVSNDCATEVHPLREDRLRFLQSHLGQNVSVPE